MDYHKSHSRVRKTQTYTASSLRVIDKYLHIRSLSLHSSNEVYSWCVNDKNETQ